MCIKISLRKTSINTSVINCYDLGGEVSPKPLDNKIILTGVQLIDGIVERGWGSILHSFY